MFRRHTPSWRRLLSVFIVLIVLTTLRGTGLLPTAQAQDPTTAYQKALERIQETKETVASGVEVTGLNLSSLGLVELPPEIGELTSLQKLVLTANALTTLPPEIGLLVNLQELDLTSNALTSLPPEIGQLANLEELYLLDNELTSLPPELGLLTNLQTLWVMKNPLESPPPDVVKQGTPAILEYLRGQLGTSEQQAEPLETELLFTLRVDMGSEADWINIGDVPYGYSSVVSVIGGAVEGPDISGEILPVGSGWFENIDGPQGVADARFVIRTNDGELITMVYHAVTTSDWSTARMTGHFETGSEQYDWLNWVLVGGTGKGEGSVYEYEVYVIK